MRVLSVALILLVASALFIAGSGCAEKSATQEAEGLSEEIESLGEIEELEEIEDPFNESELEELEELLF